MIRAAILLLALALPASAQDFPPPLTRTVSDFADILDDAAEARLTSTLEAVRSDPGTEIAVVTIRSREDYGPSASVEAFATGLFNAWGIGDPERNDGILILVATEDREMRVELGDGYAPVWDQVAENVIDNTFLPRFRDGDYTTGIVRGTDAVIARIADPFALNRAPPKERFSLLKWIFEGPGGMILMLLALGALLFRHRLSDAAFRLRRCPSCGRRFLSRVRETLDAPSADTEGRGAVTITCGHCHWQDRREYSIPSRRSTSSGAGSGFSGGRSSGGGASGRW